MLLLDRLSGRPSFSPAPTIGASLFGPPHPSSDYYSPGAVIAPQPPLETVDCPFDYGFSRPYLWLHFQNHRPPHCRANTATRAPSSPEFRRHLSFATRTPSSPELRRHLSFATRAPPSPEFYLSPELRRHLSFATRAPSSPELRRHLSFATRAPRTPEFHLSPELRRHPSFKTRDPPFSELHLRQSFVVTCASRPQLLLHGDPSKPVVT